MIDFGFPRPRQLTLCLALLLASPGLHLSAKVSEWKDTQGTNFRAEPVEVVGPFAVFRTGPRTGRRVLLRSLTAEDCVRFHDEIALRPSLATNWTAAKGEATRELIGRVLQVQRKALVPADLSRLPEPQLLLVLYGSHNDGESWAMLNNLIAVHNRIQRVYPGLLSTVFMGVRHTEAEHREMAMQAWMPWLIADFHEERSMNVLARFIPAEGTNLMLLSRAGVPLLSGRATDLADTRGFIDQLNDLLALINPDNPRAWKDRVHYLGATRLREFNQGSTGPLLVGNPLRAEGLRERGVLKVAAKLAIAADGTVTPTLLPEKSLVPEALAVPLTNALRAAVVLPAVEQGVAVAGQLDYFLEVPPANRQAEADAVWLSGEARTELPVGPWLLLRPIKVAEQDFGSEVDHETETGTVVFKPMQVSDAKVSRTAQMNAFNSNWFDAAGAASVHPQEGDKQNIDGTTLTWQTVRAIDGLVDLQTGIQRLDYTVGYAWAEFESPADMDAWLGIGSDDGLKIWLNGELVHDNWVRRPSRIDDDVVPLRLKKGRNQLLLKIQNVTIDWSFLYRLRTRGR